MTTLAVSFVRAVSCTGAALSLALAPATAQQRASTPINVAICAAASDNSGACAFMDTSHRLYATGRFGAVDVINVTAAGGGTPTLAQLLCYDALLCWTAAVPADVDAWGDVLADYVDAGGGVVVAVDANCSTLPGHEIGGRWRLGYQVIVDRIGVRSGSAFLGAVHVPSHPVMSGVTSFYGGIASFRPLGAVVAPGSTVIAEWSDGSLLVAEGRDGKRIDLGFYPPSAQCFGGGWNPSTDGTALLANALVAVATSPCLRRGVSYCTAGTTSSGCVPSISGTGHASASDGEGFTIAVDGVPGAQSGLIFYGLTGQTALPWGPGTSLMCVRSPLERAALENALGAYGSCDGRLSLDWNLHVASHPSALGTPFSGGELVFAQAWFRDPPSPKTTNLSDALMFLVSP